jgi:glucose-6-phosphate 1-dehydrogenase
MTSRAAKTAMRRRRTDPPAHLIDQIDAPPAPPCTVVIFGASGDLTHRLLLPALYNLARAGSLDPGFRVIGLSRSPMTDEQFREDLTTSMKKRFSEAGGEFDAKATKETMEKGKWAFLRERIHYLAADLGDPASYVDLANLIASLHSSEKGKVKAPTTTTNAAAVGNVIFYLAVAAALFEPTIQHLSASGLLRQSRNGWRRLIIEKPFGHDLASAKDLDKTILKVLHEDQVFRIDHFLGKETVQNIMVLRFANGIFEPLWNRQHIDHVQITASETVGVEGRGQFYDATGALRDMVPNHMFQLLAMCAMEAPNSFEADAVRTEKAKVIQAIRALPAKDAADNAVRARYMAGSVLGKHVKDYRAEPDVARDSQTETYVAMKLMIDNWRWADVPFYVRTGKALATRRTEIAIKFKQVPFAMFRDLPQSVMPANELVLHVQPEEGVSLNFQAKVPGQQLAISGVKMNMRYSDYFQAEPNTGYETLIYDCMTGDATLFQRADNIEAGWAAVQPILDAWGRGYGPMAEYKAGGFGPSAADELLIRDGRRWRDLS